MKIGIDAKWFFNGPPSGKVVIRNFVKHLITINDKHEIYLFLNKKDKDNFFPFQDDRLKLVYVWSGINLISNIFVLKRKANALKLDVVLFQNFPAYSRNFKSIAFIHDVLYLSHPEYYGFKEQLYFLPLKYLAQKCSLVITISNAEKERLITHNFAKAANIKVVYHGIDKSFQPKEKFPLSELEKIKKQFALPEKYLLYVGRLNARKNIKNLLLAFKNIENQQIPLVIVGEANHQMFDIETFIINNKLCDRVILLGSVSTEALPILYSLATVFCFPSFAEGFGLPILEAMASKIPVLTSNTTAMPEIAGDSAILVSPENISEIEAGINRLLSNDLYATQISNRGLIRSKGFSWEKSAREILNHIEETQIR